MQLMEVLDILHGLPRVDKLRAVQFPTSERAQEEAGTLLPNGKYAVWSPHDATEVPIARQEVVKRGGHREGNLPAGRNAEKEERRKPIRVSNHHPASRPFQ